MTRTYRALLVNPWIYDFAAYAMWSEPIGLLEVGAYLKSLGFEVALLDCLDRWHPDLLHHRIREDLYGCGHYLKTVIPKPDCLRHVPRRFGRYGLPLETVRRELAGTPAPDVILVTSGMTYWYPGVFLAIALARQHFPRTPVVLGGVYASLCTEHAREGSGADCVLPGDWRGALPQLLHDLDLFPRGAPADAVQPRFPDHSLRRPQGFATVAASRGCPHNCTYCAARLLYPDGWSPRPAEDVTAEIAECVECLGAADIAFYDDALLAHGGEHLEQILDELLARSVRCRFHTPNGIHTRGLTVRVAEKMKRAGFATVRLALESIGEATLRATGPKTSADDFARAVSLLKRSGFEGTDIGAYVLAGLTNQTFQEVVETIAFVHAQGVLVKLSRFSPIPGTVEWQHWVDAGWMAADADPLMHNHALPFPPGAPLTEEEYLAAVMEARRGNDALRRAT